MYRIVLYGMFVLLFLGCSRYISASRTDGKEVIQDRKGLTAIPFEYFSDSTITKMSFFANHISELDTEIAQLQQLEVLYLGKNDFKSFPKVIGELKNLRILSLAYNEIDSIPDCIGRLTKLERLLLNNNKLVYISDSIGNCRRLDQINLSRNGLKKLPESMAQLNQLYQLDVSFNTLDKLPDSMHYWRSLRDLNLQYAGPMLRIPEVGCQLRMIERIKADPAIVFPTCFLTQQTNRLIIYIEP
jgi:leucine-rich repeat protein SHOC2